MTILSVVETWSGETGSADNTWLRTYTRVFRVITDDPNHSVYDIGSHPSIPLLWSLHPDDLRTFCDKITPKRISGSREVWDVTCTYTNKVEEDTEPDENPLNRPWKLSWTSQLFTKVAERGIKRETIDARGNVIVPAPGGAILGPLINSAGDQFDPPVEIEQSNWQLTAKKNIATVPTWLMDYRDSLNHSAITIAGILFQRGELRINSMSIGPFTYENKVGFYPFEIQIAQKSETWIRELLDQGTHEVKTLNVGGTPTQSRLRVVDKKGQHVTEPVRLDGLGHKLADDALMEESIFIRYQVYLKERDYSALALPTT